MIFVNEKGGCVIYQYNFCALLHAIKSISMYTLKKDTLEKIDFFFRKKIVQKQLMFKETLAF